MPSTEIEFLVKTDQSNSLEYHMNLGGIHHVTGSCASKKEGKQLAAQALLQVQQSYVYENYWHFLDVCLGVASIC